MAPLRCWLAFVMAIVLGLGIGCDDTDGSKITGSDTTAPSVAIAAPLGGQTISATVTVSVSAADNGTVARVEIRVDGTLAATLTASPYEHDIDTTQLADGPHTIRATAIDAANNSGFHEITVAVSNAGVPLKPWQRGTYFPEWQNIAPTNTIVFTHDGGKTDEQNGADLKAAIAALQPGDKLVIGSGTYSVNSFWNVVISGTAAAPIWIVAGAGNPPVITRPDAAQNILNMGSGTHVEYLCIRGLEFTGGDSQLRLYDCSQVWVDACTFHTPDAEAITANSANTDYVFITRNDITTAGTTGTGEGMYLGANASAYRMTNSVIAMNHVHNCAGSQGDGIEVKQGSYDNWIVENHVHDTNYPCILVYGTDGLGINVIERNTCYRSNDNAMQVQGEAIVRNNLVISATGAAFTSTDHQGTTSNLTVVHNTFVNAGRATNLSSWDGRANMVFANNAVYSETAESIRFPNGSTGVTVAGNVTLGTVQGVASGFVAGTSLAADFDNLSADATVRNATPKTGGALIGAASNAHAVVDDLNGNPRTAPYETGCIDR